MLRGDAAAGINAPVFVAKLGRPTTVSGQLEVTPARNVSSYKNLSAIGDYAACTLEDGRRVPPRAQATREQAG